MHGILVYNGDSSESNARLTRSLWRSAFRIRETTAVYLLKPPFHSALSVVYATDWTLDAMRQSRFRL
jgi:hypothetical protein